jgi:hypothetical protein
MLQISQTEKPMCSATIDQIRLRRAMNLPLEFQNCVSSGFQSEIQVFMLIALSFSASNPAFADPTCARPHANKKRHVRKDAIFRFLQDSGVAVGPSLDRAAAHLNAQRRNSVNSSFVPVA